jgi:hypothetical protein
MELDIKHNNKKWQDADETEMHQLLEDHCKGVVIDLPACEQCSSLLEGSQHSTTPLNLKLVLHLTTPLNPKFVWKRSFLSNEW